MENNESMKIFTSFRKKLRFFGLIFVENLILLSSSILILISNN